MTEIPAEIKEAFESEINSICLTWDHSFGLMPEDRREGLRRCFRQLGDHHIYRLILAAEQRGAEREREDWAALAEAWEVDFRSAGQDEIANVMLNFAAAIRSRGT